MALNVLPQIFEYNQHFVAMMNIINAARLNPPTKGHRHHIVPRCWFKMNNLPIDNSDENLVLLTKEQHGKIHKLMSLCAKDAQLKRNMVIAAHFMGLPSTSLHYTLSEETRKKISEAKKGKPSPMKGKNSPMYGRTGNRNPMYGKNHSDESRRKMSEAKKGKPSWNKGIHMSDKAKKKLSEVNKGKRKGMHWKVIDGKRVRLSKEEA